MAADNYVLQLQQAQQHFLTYDSDAIARKMGLESDAAYLYVNFLCKLYRLSRTTGSLERLEDTWTDANTHGQVMTLLDILCDSREDRHPAGRYQSMEAFGLMFHRNLLEDRNDPTALFWDREPMRLRLALEALGGIPYPGADISYTLELTDDLRMLVQFWHGDEEFAPRIRWLWDENALQYLRYETMYFAVGVLRSRIAEEMEKSANC